MVFVGLYVYAAAVRVTYPFDLEWEEGAFMDHVLRVVHGQPIYVRPSIEFTPFIYTPAYYYVGAAAVRVFGESIVTLRLVSIVCSLGLLVVLALFGWRERGSVAAGLTAAGLFAATYEIGGTWFDVARVDSLFLLLLLGSVYLVRFGNSAASMVSAGLLLTMALLTKQLALIIAPFLLVFAVLRLGRRGLIAGAVFATTAAVAITVLHSQSHGWFLYYTFRGVANRESIFGSRALSFFTGDLLGAFPVATLLGIGWCAAVWRVGSFEDRWFYSLLGLAFIGGAWETRLHPGAWLWFPVPIGRYYRLTGFVPHSSTELWPPTGNRVRPQFVYEPRQ